MIHGYRPIQTITELEAKEFTYLCALGLSATDIDRGDFKFHLSTDDQKFCSADFQWDFYGSFIDINDENMGEIFECKIIFGYPDLQIKVKTEDGMIELFENILSRHANLLKAQYENFKRIKNFELNYPREQWWRTKPAFEIDKYID